jgi:uncharacterized membrane protein
MNGIKEWYKSKAVLSGIATIATLVLGAFGFTFSEADMQEIVVIATTVVGSITTLISVYGRVKATKKLK